MSVRITGVLHLGLICQHVVSDNGGKERLTGDEPSQHLLERAEGLGSLGGGAGERLDLVEGGDYGVS